MPCADYSAVRRTNRTETAWFLPARDDAQASQVVAVGHLAPRSTGNVARFDAATVNVNGSAGSGVLYYVSDELGTSRVITTNTGTVCYDGDFYPYGGERAYTNSCPQPYKFEGQ